MKLHKTILFSSFNLFAFLVLATSCKQEETLRWDNINEEGAFIVHRRQSPIGEETYKIRSTEDSIIVTSLQGENERGRISGLGPAVGQRKTLPHP